MYVIGLTGGVGSGKSEAAHMLADIAQAEILLADNLGHLAMEKGTQGYRQIVEHFGEIILDEHREISRGTLAEIVFSKQKELQILNGIVHPIVKEHLKQYIDERKEQKGYIVLESAIMFETGCDTLCDEIWYVFVPARVRKERLRQSRGYTEQKTEQIMKQQLEEEEFKNRCQIIIANEGSLDDLNNLLKNAFISSKINR